MKELVFRLQTGNMANYPSVLQILSFPSGLVCHLKAIIFRSSKHTVPSFQFSFSLIHDPVARPCLNFSTVRLDLRGIVLTRFK